MDMTCNDYIDFINHLFMQEFVDMSYHSGHIESTVDSLTTL